MEEGKEEAWEELETWWFLLGSKDLGFMYLES